MKPIIAVTAGAVANQLEPWSPTIYGQSQTYIEAIVQAGGVPFIVPIVDDKKALRELYKLADGILFSGGNDVDPALYGEEPYPGTTDISSARDAAEVQFMRWALQDNKPLLGICRGMQLLNIVCGGSCYQDIPTDLPKALDHTSSTKRKSREHLAHVLRLDPESQLAKILKANSIRTNTHHHQAIKVLGRGLVSNCWAEDGLIEGVELVGDGFAIGVQSHPESLVTQAEIGWRKLFSALIQASTRVSVANLPLEAVTS